MADHHHIEGAGGAALCGARPPYEPLILYWDGATGQPILRPPCGDCCAINQAAHAAGNNSIAASSSRQPDDSRAAAPVVPSITVPVVISMTSVPSRNGTLGPTIDSLYGQSRQPDGIRLYLGPGCDDVRDELVKCWHGADYGPVTKLSAVMDPEVPGNSIVITVDDDIVYGREWLATLLRAVANHPEEAVGFAGWNADVLLQTGRYERVNGLCDVIEGFGGVAYHKWFFGPDVMNPPDSVRWVDDVWISSYLNRAGIARRVIPGADTLVDIRRSLSSGIHHRPDFDDLNKQGLRLFKYAERSALEERRERMLP